MTNRIADIPQHKAAKIAGFMFLFAFIVPTLNWAFVLSKFNVVNDALATANNIMANEFLFRMGLFIELIMSIRIDSIGAGSFYITQNNK